MPDTLSSPPASSPASSSLLVCLPAMAEENLAFTLSAITAAFPDEQVLVAAPAPITNPADHPTLQHVAYTSERTDIGWVLAAGDYAAAASLSLQHSAVKATIVLTDNATNLDPQLLRNLAASIRSNVDLALPQFHFGPSNGLVNAALLYPLSRALFGSDIRFPLAVDAAFSPRMAQRIATNTQRLVNLNQASSLFWPVAEASVAGFTVRSVDAVNTTSPQPPNDDFNTLFNTVASSLFTDIESKAAFWQRARTLPPPATLPPATPAPASTVPEEAVSMIESFHLAYSNLQEIWSLVLPPQSRLALKKLALSPAETFAMEPALWSRIVYDFALAFHLRTLNRGHLLGAMTPLYLAWVASHLITTADDPLRAEETLAHTAAAFDTEKSYFVSRWRWPDRFNP